MQSPIGTLHSWRRLFKSISQSHLFPCLWRACSSVLSTLSTSPPFTSVHLTLLILVRTKSNYQLRFTCVVDLTCKGLLSSLNGYIVVFQWGYSSVGRNHRRENVAFVVPGLLVWLIGSGDWSISASMYVYMETHRTISSKGSTIRFVSNYPSLVMGWLCWP